MTPERGKDGEIRRIMVIIRDVSERARAEAVQRATHLRLEEAVSAGGVGLWDLDPSEVSSGYRELADLNCKYRNCLHRSEPGCAAAAAVESGEVDEERFESYRHLVEELLQDDEGRQNQRRR